MCALIKPTQNFNLYTMRANNETSPAPDEIGIPFAVAFDNSSGSMFHVIERGMGRVLGDVPSRRVHASTPTALRDKLASMEVDPSEVRFLTREEIQGSSIIDKPRTRPLTDAERVEFLAA